MQAVNMTGWTLAQWARARREDIHAREHGNSLLVGPGKPLGGQGFPASPRGAWALWKSALATRKRADAVHRPVRFVSGGAVGGSMWIYAYDVLAMRDLLLGYRFGLRDCGWPVDADAVVARIRAEMVPPRSYLYTFIADCHGDRLNPGRADVMPHCARVDLLDAYLDEHGEPDPSFIYFAAAHQPIPERYDAFLPPRSPS